MSVRLVTTDGEIRSAYPVMRQLRPRYDEEAFLASVRRQQADGYRLAVLEEEGAVVAAAGYRYSENLAWGRFLYVDDLVTDEARRSGGCGQRLMAWLVAEGRKEACDELHLDSGVQRFGAHRFYLRCGMDITSHHFRIQLDGA